MTAHDLYELEAAHDRRERKREDLAYIPLHHTQLHSEADTIVP